MNIVATKTSTARLAGVVALVWIALATNAAPAQLVTQSPTTVPASADRANGLDGSLERLPIGAARPTAGRAGATTSTAIQTSPARSIGFDLGRMAIALLIVVALIFGLRWLATHFFVGARAPATSRAIKVLGRTSLAPRQQVLLLQVGRRVIVVGESNGQLSTLSQMDDPDEIASLVGQLQEEQMQRGAAFGGLFGRVQKRFNGEEEDDEHSARDLPELEGRADHRRIGMDEPSLEPANDSQAKSELAGLVDKVRAIRDQLGRQ